MLRTLHHALVLGLVLSSGLVVRAQAQDDGLVEANAPAGQAPAGDSVAAPTAESAAMPAAPGEPAATSVDAEPPQPAATRVPASPPESEAVERARGRFAQGVALANAGNCKAALVEFEAAYGLSPRPNMLYNMAHCYERMFRYERAIEYYRRYLDDAPAAAEERATVEAALGTLANLLGRIEVRSNVPAEIWVDDRLAGEAPGDVLVPGGRHTIELRAPGHIPAAREVKVAGRDHAVVSFMLERGQTTIEVTQTTGLPPTLFWVGVGATVAAGALGTVFALQVNGKTSDADELLPQDPRRRGLQDDAEQAALTADIFFGGALVLGVATVIVGFVTEWDGDTADRQVAPEAAPVTLSPLLGPRLAGVTLRGAL